MHVVPKLDDSLPNLWVSHFQRTYYQITILNQAGALTLRHLNIAIENCPFHPISRFFIY